MTPPTDHPAIPPSRVGILLINLGTPDAPDTASVRRYLAEFLSDPRVVEIPQLVWQPILRGAILTTRPKKSAHAYQQVWMPEGSVVPRGQSCAPSVNRSGVSKRPPQKCKYFPRKIRSADFCGCRTHFR